MDKRLERVEEAADIAVKYLMKSTGPTKLRQEGGGTGDQENAKYGAVCLEGDLVLKSQSYPCHAFMSSFPHPVTVYNKLCYRHPVTKEIAEAYFDWIMSDTGPWKEFKGRNISHLPAGLKDARTFIYKHGWVWKDLKDHPSNLQHNFLVASRMPAEWPERIVRWYDYVEKGIHPGIAFIFLDMFVRQDDKHFVINRTNTYDWPTDPCTAGEEYVKNFCLGRVERLNKSYFDDVRYTPVNRIFGENLLGRDDKKAYPNVLYRKYSDKFGLSKEKSKEYWTAGRLGWSSYSHFDKWTVSPKEILEIIHLEEERLLA